MSIESFQKKLDEIIKLAKINNNRMDQNLIKHFFVEDHLDEDQTASVLEYLQSQGIHIQNTSRDTAETEEGKILSFAAEKSPDPLTEEEEEYLKEYQEGIRGGFESDEEEKKLLKATSAGDEDAKRRLVEAYIPEVISSVKRHHRKELTVADMLQEGNLGLISALEDLSDGDVTDLHKTILDSIDHAILSSIQEQEQQKWQDHALIGKVEKLESAVRQLTDESEDKFSVEELSALLDMSVDEIKDVLRLTGDDK